MKAKWAHWKVLGEMSGFGWNEDLELYDANDYVWDNLNKAYPGIIWHKSYVMPFREQLGTILHNVQANGNGALTLATPIPIPIDPRLETLRIQTPSTSTPPRPSALSANTVNIYNKGKKRAMEVDNDEEAGPSTKKVDIGVAITGLTKEMALARKAKETFESSQRRAIRLLTKEYRERLLLIDFVAAITYFKDEGNATTFLVIDDVKIRNL